MMFVPSDATANTGAGSTCTLSADGSRVVAGSGGHGHGGISSGAVWIVSGPATSTQTEVELLPSAPQSSMGFALALAMNGPGDVLLVGAPLMGPSALRPEAFLYRFDGSSWQEEWHKESALYDAFGNSVAISAVGDVFAIGRPRYTPHWNIQDLGAVNVYRPVAGTWTLESVPYPADYPGHASMYFGNYIAMSADGNTLAIRSWSTFNSPQANGAIYVYEYDASGWVESAKLQEPIAYSDGGFATAIAVDAPGTTVVAGNWQDSRFANYSGAATVFRKSSSGWSCDGVLLSTAPAANGSFGMAVAINDAGDRIVVGEPGATIGGLTSAGSVTEFERTSAGWNPVSVHVAPTPTGASFFGRSVAMSASGRRWIAGEHQADVGASNTGALHMFDVPCPPVTVYCTAQVNSLGCTPAISGVGAPSCSQPTGFSIAAQQVRNQQSGLLFYGTNGRAAQPFQGGTLCVRQPLKRTTLQTSGGSPAPTADCTGTFAFDFNAWVYGTSDPALFPGQHIYAQYYSRDAGATPKVNLTDAIEFYLEP